jgi:putative hemolysin
MFVYELVVIGIMLAINAVFAAYEMGLASISRARLTMLVNERRKGSRDAIFMKDHMEASLAIIQLGITVVGAVAAATGGAGVTESFSPHLQRSFGLTETPADVLALALLVIPLTYLTIVFAELVPKMVALRNNEMIVLRLSPVMRRLSRVAYPLVYVIEATVKAIMTLLPHPARTDTGGRGQWLHELRAAVSLARTSKLLGEREEKIVLSAAHLSIRPVRDIVIPARDVSMIPIDSSLMAALVQAHMDMHTRFPVCTTPGDPQSITAYVNFKDIVAAMHVNPKDPSIRGISRPIQKVPEDTVLSQLLETMIQQKNHIVLVVSKEDRVLGMVTLEDIMEELVGDIEDEFDRLPAHIHPSGHGWIVGGGVPIATIAATVGLDAPAVPEKSRSLTLAEWSRQHAPAGFKGGDAFESDGLKVTARKFRRQKLMEAVVIAAGKQDRRDPA